ncbi:hypothetical protein [Oceanobacillus salinisoli]|uniref:hypothetical protein n=1 Tax=Oceanobacillus salinisoli TaxID=2678611 RepID=UPI0012E231A9|nr:hypothetical protein [Oceanobacillus salinisoli]
MLQVILIIIGLIIIGLIIKFDDLIKLNKELTFIGDYNDKYVNYLNQYLYTQNRIRDEKEAELYTYLVKNAGKCQQLLGLLGYVDYRPPFAGYMIKNYQVIVNVVPSLRNPKGLSDEFQWVNNHLLMQISRHEEAISDRKREIVNPFSLLQEGVKFIVTLPITLLYWTGIIKYTTMSKLSNNIAVKFLNFIVIIVGLVGSVLTIVAGWDTVINIYNELKQRI